MSGRRLRIDATREAARSLMLLLEAIERGELVATPLEIARLQGAVEALGAIAGELPGDEVETRGDKLHIPMFASYFDLKKSAR